jgi:hypothetical protein
MNNPRDYALELIDDGSLNARDVAMMCVKWMSKHDVEEMLKANEMDPRSIAARANGGSVEDVPWFYEERSSVEGVPWFYKEGEV